MNSPSLQAALLKYLVEHRGVRGEARQVIVVPSAQAAIELIARVVLNAGDLAWLESPGYSGAGAALTLVAAPAGYGKTTAVRAWCAGSETALAWVGNVLFLIGGGGYLATVPEAKNRPLVTWKTP